MTVRTETPQDDLNLADDPAFIAGAKALAREAEDLRLSFMRRNKNRGAFLVTLSLMALIAGGCGFGWFFFIAGNMFKAFSCVILALALPLLLSRFYNVPLHAYRRAYKAKFMPRMAALMGNLKYFPHRGISAELLARTGALPAHKHYEAEDCFAGIYKNVRVIFSEARLYQSRADERPIFSGLFVLLELPHDVFEGHTIITADHEAAARYEPGRWKKLTRLHDLRPKNQAWDRFAIFSTRPQDAHHFVGDNLFKELSEIIDAFDGAAVTAVLFRGRNIFMMVPTHGDMFEASSMAAPIRFEKHAAVIRTEVARLTQIIDVLELYKPRTGPLNLDPQHDFQIASEA